jgi:hypothetical protein
MRRFLEGARLNCQQQAADRAAKVALPAVNRSHLTTAVSNRLVICRAVSIICPPTVAIT